MKKIITALAEPQLNNELKKKKKGFYCHWKRYSISRRGNRNTGN